MKTATRWFIISVINLLAIGGWVLAAYLWPNWLTAWWFTYVFAGLLISMGVCVSVGIRLQSKR